VKSIEERARALAADAEAMGLKTLEAFGFNEQKNEKVRTYALAIQSLLQDVRGIDPETIVATYAYLYAVASRILVASGDVH
jgi:hypothetical protein